MLRVVTVLLDTFNLHLGDGLQATADTLFASITNVWGKVLIVAGLRALAEVTHDPARLMSLKVHALITNVEKK